MAWSNKELISFGSLTVTDTGWDAARASTYSINCVQVRICIWCLVCSCVTLSEDWRRSNSKDSSIFQFGWICPTPWDPVNSKAAHVLQLYAGMLVMIVQYIVQKFEKQLSPASRLVALVMLPTLYPSQVAKPSLSHRSLHQLIVTRLPNHWKDRFIMTLIKNKPASLEATLVRNSAHVLTGVKCRATSIAKKLEYLVCQFMCNNIGNPLLCPRISFLIRVEYLNK